jgi:hypothetical protein
MIWRNHVLFPEPLPPNQSVSCRKFQRDLLGAPPSLAKVELSSSANQVDRNRFNQAEFRNSPLPDNSKGWRKTPIRCSLIYRFRTWGVYQHGPGLNYNEVEVVRSECR